MFIYFEKSLKKPIWTSSNSSNSIIFAKDRIYCYSSSNQFFSCVMFHVSNLTNILQNGCYFIEATVHTHTHTHTHIYNRNSFIVMKGLIHQSWKLMKLVLWYSGFYWNNLEIEPRGINAFLFFFLNRNLCMRKNMRIYLLLRTNIHYC